MGEIADMTINGDMCQYCGEFIWDDNGELVEGDGFPVCCEGCQDE